jgi:FlaA1/EpsC-like NDP-sugar epimerase
MLDDDPRTNGRHCMGVPVVGAIDDLPRVAAGSTVHQAVLAVTDPATELVRRAADLAEAAQIPLRVLRGVAELVHGHISLRDVRDLRIEDLLGREQVVTDLDAVRRLLCGRRVLVTGAGGSIGSELCRQIALASPASITLVGHGENSIFDTQSQLRERFPAVPVQAVIADIRDQRRLETCFASAAPQVVFHAAAHKHVPLMEENPEEAITNNVVGTSHVVNACVAAGVEKLVMISTDKAVSPTSMMGASKRLAEMIVREAARRHGRAFVVVRFGNVLGSRGSVVPVFKRQIEAGGPITITHPGVKRFFMTIPEAVHLVLQAGGLASGGELFVLNMGEAVPIVQLAEDLIRLSGLTTAEVPIVYTGLRPGEKLEEVLWEADARVEPTSHRDVLRVTEHDPIDGRQLARSLATLAAEASSGDRLRLEAALAQWIPSYVPSSVQKHFSLAKNP